MTTPAEDFDVVVVGGSVAGCTAARLFAQRGASVALVERRADPAAYKVTCTHAILPPATPAIERLGLAPRLTERGVPRTWPELWTPHGGWFGDPDSRGWGVTRRTLDPLLRDLAASTPGVEFLPGYTAKRVLRDGGRPAGIEVWDPEGRSLRLGSRLLVAADGANRRLPVSPECRDASGRTIASSTSPTGAGWSEQGRRPAPPCGCGFPTQTARRNSPTRTVSRSSWASTRAGA